MEEQLESGAIESEKSEETHQAVNVLQGVGEQSHSRHVDGDVLVCEKSLEGHSEGGTLKGELKDDGGREFSAKLNYKEEQESEGVQEQEEAVSLESKQSCQGHVEGGASQSRLGHSTQKTEMHETKNTEKRLGNKRNNKPKSSPRKRQRAEESC